LGTNPTVELRRGERLLVQLHALQLYSYLAPGSNLLVAQGKGEKEVHRIAAGCQVANTMAHVCRTRTVRHRQSRLAQTILSRFGLSVICFEMEVGNRVQAHPLCSLDLSAPSQVAIEFAFMPKAQHARQPTKTAQKMKRTAGSSAENFGKPP
jgi:hypothetical protein